MTSVPSIKAPWHRRWSRLVVWTGFTLLTLVVLACFWTNWHGARAWIRVQDEVTRSGETLDFHAAADEPAPVEENFGGLPVFENITLQDESEAGKKAQAARERLAVLALPANRPGIKPRPKTGRGMELGRKADLSAWAAWLREEGALALPPGSGNPARDILTAMAVHNPLVQEITAGLDRPGSQWTPVWKTRELPRFLMALSVPHYHPLQEMAGWFSFRSIAAARAGDTRTAHESLLTLIKIVQATERDPLLIGTLVAAVQTSLLANAVWEVCEARAGTAEDFQRLQQELARMDPTASLLLAFRGEMTMMGSSIQWLRGKPEPSLLAGILGGPGEERKVALGLKLVPRGWFDANAAKIVSLQLHYVIEPLRDHGLAGCIAKQEDLEALLSRYREHPFLHLDAVIARLSLPSTRKIAERVAYTHSRLLQARAACALEAHWLARQKYPAALGELQDAAGRPVILPVDPLNTQPLDYETTDGRYRLWSRGFDRQNDGGKRTLQADSPENTKFASLDYKGDWVWSYTPEPY